MIETVQPKPKRKSESKPKPPKVLPSLESLGYFIDKNIPIPPKATDKGVTRGKREHTHLSRLVKSLQIGDSVQVQSYQACTMRAVGSKLKPPVKFTMRLMGAYTRVWRIS